MTVSSAYSGDLNPMEPQAAAAGSVWSSEGGSTAPSAAPFGGGVGVGRGFLFQAGVSQSSAVGRGATAATGDPTAGRARTAWRSKQVPLSKAPAPSEVPPPTGNSGGAKTNESSLEPRAHSNPDLAEILNSLSQATGGGSGPTAAGLWRSSSSGSAAAGSGSTAVDDLRDLVEKLSAARMSNAAPDAKQTRPWAAPTPAAATSSNGNQQKQEASSTTIPLRPKFSSTVSHLPEGIRVARAPSAEGKPSSGVKFSGGQIGSTTATASSSEASKFREAWPESSKDAQHIDSKMSQLSVQDYKSDRHKANEASVPSVPPAARSGVPGVDDELSSRLGNVSIQGEFTKASELRKGPSSTNVKSQTNGQEGRGQQVHVAPDQFLSSKFSGMSVEDDTAGQRKHRQAAPPQPSFTSKLQKPVHDSGNVAKEAVSAEGVNGSKVTGAPSFATSHLDKTTQEAQAELDRLHQGFDNLKFSNGTSESASQESKASQAQAREQQKLFAAGNGYAANIFRQSVSNLSSSTFPPPSSFWFPATDQQQQDPGKVTAGDTVNAGKVTAGDTVKAGADPTNTQTAASPSQNGFVFSGLSTSNQGQHNKVLPRNVRRHGRTPHSVARTANARSAAQPNGSQAEAAAPPNANNNSVKGPDANLFPRANLQDMFFAAATSSQHADKAPAAPSSASNLQEFIAAPVATNFSGDASGLKHSTGATGSGDSLHNPSAQGVHVFAERSSDSRPVWHTEGTQGWSFKFSSGDGQPQPAGVASKKNRTNLRRTAKPPANKQSNAAENHFVASTHSSMFQPPSSGTAKYGPPDANGEENVFTNGANSTSVPGVSSYQYGPATGTGVGSFNRAPSSSSNSGQLASEAIASKKSSVTTQSSFGFSADGPAKQDAPFMFSAMTGSSAHAGPSSGATFSFTASAEAPIEVDPGAASKPCVTPRRFHRRRGPNSGMKVSNASSKETSPQGDYQPTESPMDWTPPPPYNQQQQAAPAAHSISAEGHRHSAQRALVAPLYEASPSCYDEKARPESPGRVFLKAQTWRRNQTITASTRDQQNSIPQGAQAKLDANGINASVNQSDRRAGRAEIHRRAGNMSYKNGQYGPAEIQYTAAIEDMKSSDCNKSELARIYSNRAACRLMLQQPVSAANDCHSALVADPNFSRAHLRLATCKLRVGQFASARQALQPLLRDWGMPDTKEAHAKLESIEKAFASANSAVNMLNEKRLCEMTTGQLEQALLELSAAIRSSELCPTLQAWRCEAMLRLGRLEEAKQLAAAAPCPELEEHCTLSGRGDMLRWRWWIPAQAAWHAAELDKVVLLLKKGLAQVQQDSRAATTSMDGSDRVIPYPAPSEEQLQQAIQRAEHLISLKEQGNEAIKANKSKESRELYSSALASPGCPATFSAVLLSNIAAAFHTEGDVLEAIAHCSRARALRPDYSKPYSRLATLMLGINRPDAAITILQAMQEACQLSDAEKRDVERRIRDARRLASMAKACDHYRLLGLERTCTAEEVRRAYKKLALKYHPDKAISAVSAPAASMPGVSPLASDCALRSWEARLREEAAWVFKYVGEAHDVLSDAAKRAALDRKLAPSHAPTSSSSGAARTSFRSGRTGASHPVRTGPSYPYSSRWAGGGPFGRGHYGTTGLSDEDDDDVFKEGTYYW